MRAIVTRANNDGTFDTAGMNNKIVTADYVLLRNLIKYGIPSHFWKRPIKLELYGQSIQCDPAKTLIINLTKIGRNNE